MGEAREFDARSASDSLRIILADDEHRARQSLRATMDERDAARLDAKRNKEAHEDMLARWGGLVHQLRAYREVVEWLNGLSHGDRRTVTLSDILDNLAEHQQQQVQRAQRAASNQVQFGWQGVVIAAEQARWRELEAERDRYREAAHRLVVALDGSKLVASAAKAYYELLAMLAEEPV